ncbi:MAG: ABC transporter ATP-binding protein [Rickettsiales bacterium]
MSNIVLDLKNIHRSYAQPNGALPILKGADLTLKQGELVALVGPSGSGKTTLLQIAGLLDKQDAGEIMLNDISMTDANDAVRTAARNQHLGFIYQFHHLLPECDAIENVMMPLLIAGVSRADAQHKAKALLERLGLGERLDHLPSRLSGGEQQRVAIARALVHSPSLVLADEPTGNLDPTTSANVCALFFEVARAQNTAVLLVTHNTQLAEQMHRRVTLRDGNVVAA